MEEERVRKTYIVQGEKGKYDRRIIYAANKREAKKIATGSFGMSVDSTVTELKKKVL